MEVRSPLQSFENINTRLFFALIFIYLIIFSFQGLDFLDEGFIVTFYQQIFKAPQTVEYNFMFWFSGVIGGAFYKLFPDMGLWGFRLLGAATTTFTLYLSYRLLKKYVDRGYVKVGILLTLLMFSNNVKSFHYNSLSSLFYVITSIFLFTGLKKNQYWRLFLAGSCIALDTFTRIPSVVNLGLVLGIAYYGFIYSTPIKQQLKQGLTFFAGFVVAILAVLLFMKMIGQYDYFMIAIQHIREMGGGGEGSDYGIFKLIKGFIKNYGLAVVISSVAIAFIAGMLYLFKKMKLTQAFNITFPIVAIGVVVLLIATRLFSHNRLILFYTGTVLITGAAILWSSKDKDLKALTFIAGYTLLAYPLGSSDSLNTVGIYSLWLALPIAVNYLLSLKPGLLQITRTSKIDTTYLLSTISNWRVVKYTLVTACVLSSLYYAYYYPLFDRHDRVYMHYQPDTNRLQHIYTTQEKAGAINDFLRESRKYVSSNDDLLAYPSIAMVHFMTETNPYLHNPAPWLYEAEYFKQQLDTVYKEKNKLPVVISTPAIRDELSAYHKGALSESSAWDKKNMKRTLYFEAFLNEHGYKEVWANDLFIIYIPPALQH